MTKDLLLRNELPCPCKSGKTIGSCSCLQFGRWRFPAAEVRLPTGPDRHPRCYAKELGGCSSKLTLEHYLSHAIQKVLAGPEGMIKIRAGTEERTVPAKTLGCKVLCEAHNNALSPLDDVGLRFFTALRMLGPSLEGGAAADLTLFGVNGLDVERWMLKLLIGAATGFLQETKADWWPPLHW